MTVHVLTLSCPDRPGIVAAVSQRLFELGANILENAQFSEPSTDWFCLRTRFDVAIDSDGAIRDALADTAGAFDAELAVRSEATPCRVLVLVSKYDHCLIDLLYRWRAGDLSAEIVAVASNHPDLQPIADQHGVPWHYPTDEAQVRSLVASLEVDLVVLARYMQILSPELCADLPGRIINIHHSFLPGFKGARPYHQAWDRGVKVIGATAHYVTAELDEGPIIEQDVAHVSHAHTPEQMRVIGRDLERVVLSRAVRSHAEGRVFLLGHRTVVFT